METAIKIEHISKQYRLGSIGGGTFKGDLQSWMAKLRGKENPNLQIGVQQTGSGDRFLALDDVSFSVQKGERIGIIGHNGAGKSTLLKLLSRVTAPTAGTISYNGRIASMLEVGTGFHHELTGRENVYLNGAILGMSRNEIDQKFDEIVAFAEMEKFIDTPVKRYSSGMYVKLAFAVAAHLDSEILVMDEVLAVGDLKFQQKCLGKMDDVSKTEGRTILYVSHNMNTIRQLCTRCIVLEHGRIIFDGDVEKAIAIYTESNYNCACVMDYRSFTRPSWLQEDSLRVSRAEFLNSTNCMFNRGAPMQIRLTWDNNKDVPNLSLRFEILNKSEEPIATSVLTDFYTGKAGDSGSVTLEYRFPELAPGEYKSYFTFFHQNQFGSHQDVDWVHGLNFTVEDTPDSTLPHWVTKHWGSIVLPSPTILH